MPQAGTGTARLPCGHKVRRGPVSASILSKSGEQSQNVYENKGRGQTVRAGADIAVDICDAPEAQAGEVVPLVLTCPFGTSQTPDTPGLRHPWTRKPAEQSENVYENKGQIQKVAEP
jgi:hypothetical protein